MPAATGTVRHPKGPAEPATGPDAATFLRASLDSSVGAKILVGITGLGLVLFVIFHLIGNLKLLPGGIESRNAINGYAHFLKHDLGLLLWFARIGLLVIFVLHIVLAVRLKLRSVAARPVAYTYSRTAQAGVASRTMVWTGIVIGLFTLFHLAHYTFAWVNGTEVFNPKTGQLEWTNYLELEDPQGRHNVYEMMVAGFSSTPIAVLYVVAQLFLFVHLRHGIPSLFQTLGLKNARFRGPIDWLGLVVALFILIGNCLIVLAVQLGYVQSLLPSM
jgi:succinate dehydrogenase / fumarate reductase cytochrome b subunit